MPLAGEFLLLDYLPDRRLPRLVGERQEKRRSETAATTRPLMSGRKAASAAPACLCFAVSNMNAKNQL
jgi:hypothetical protein